MAAQTPALLSMPKNPAAILCAAKPNIPFTHRQCLMEFYIGRVFHGILYPFQRLSQLATTALHLSARNTKKISIFIKLTLTFLPMLA
jgi:hypothetical protein